jgi:putative membrane protein
MKKLSYVFIIALAAYAMQGCNSAPKDAKESADSVNKAKDTSAMSADTMKAMTSDAKFATSAAAGGIAEIELSKLAKQKTSDAQIKKFAEMMVKDHSKAGDSLMEIAKKENITLPAAMDADHQKKYDDISKLTGTDFDKAYVNLMVDEHKGALQLMQDEAKNGKDPALAAFAGKTAAVVQMHLDAVNKIHDSMK